MTTPRPKYLTMAEAADALGISVQRVGQLVAEQKLGPAKVFPVGYRKIKHLPRAQITARLKVAASLPPTAESPK